MSLAQPAAWAGIDTAKVTFDASIAHPSQALVFDLALLHVMPVRTFARTREGAKEFVAWARKQTQEVGTGLRVVMEATGNYSIELAAWLTEIDEALLPAIANPKRTANYIKSLGLRNKTDKLEARALALYGLQRTPAPYEPLTTERAELRSLLRYRDALVDERVAERQRADETCACKAVSAMQKRRIEQLDRDIKSIEKNMRGLLTKTPTLKRDYELLTSIYGVAFVTASVILAEIGDLRRFTRARQLSAFAGLCPRLVHSGTSQRGSHLSKDGNRRVREALYMAVSTALRGDNQIAHFHRMLVQKGKRPMAAHAAAMRKLLTIMRAILITERAYDSQQGIGGKLCGKSS